MHRGGGGNRDADVGFPSSPDDFSSDSMVAEVGENISDGASSVSDLEDRMGPLSYFHYPADPLADQPGPSNPTSRTRHPRGSKRYRRYYTRCYLQMYPRFAH